MFKAIVPISDHTLSYIFRTCMCGLQT